MPPANNRRPPASTTPPLRSISVTTRPEAEDAVVELCARVSNLPAASYTDVETGAVTVTFYEPTRVRPKRNWKMLLKPGIAQIRSAGLDVGAGHVIVRRIRRQDWAESWKRHFAPLEFEKKLLVKPGWSRRRPRRGQAVLVLDPGLSFGTGQHPTTGFCLREVTRRRLAGRRQSLLDIGTGSGILAIAAAKLGYRPIRAFDFDPRAVQVARANARRNRVNVRISPGDVTRMRPAQSSFDIVCANLISTLLISERDRIAAQVKPGGVLLLAGILTAEFSQVRRAYESIGFRLQTSTIGNEWRSGAFVNRTREGRHVAIPN